MALNLTYNTIDVFDYGVFRCGDFVQSGAVDGHLIGRIKMAYASLPAHRAA